MEKTLLDRRHERAGRPPAARDRAMDPRLIVLRVSSVLSVLSAWCAAASPALAQIPVQIPPMPAVSALVTGAYDGDTLHVEAAVWPDVVWTGSVRVLGIDTPEIRGGCDRERRLAVVARDHVRELLVDESVVLTDIENDKYAGRVLANVHLDNGELLGDRLIQLGYAQPYDGGTRRDWCDGSIMSGTEPNVPDEPEEPDGDPNHPLTLYDDNGNGRISCAEARAHGIAPVYWWHAAYPYMTDTDGDGVVCE